MAKDAPPQDDGLEREPHYGSLAPDRMRLFRDETGRLRLTIEEDRSYLDVKVVAAFPLSEPGRYVGLLDSKYKVIVLVPDPRELGEQSQGTIAAALAHHYFTPTIRQVRRAKEEFGAFYFSVDTDHGPRDFVVKGARDTLEELGEGCLLLKDVDGNRYRIDDWRRLSHASRRLLEKLL